MATVELKFSMFFLLNFVFQLSTAHIMSFSVTMRCASPVTTSATMTLTVMTAVMSLLAVR